VTDFEFATIADCFKSSLFVMLRYFPGATDFGKSTEEIDPLGLLPTAAAKWLLTAAVGPAATEAAAGVLELAT